MAANVIRQRWEQEPPEVQAKYRAAAEQEEAYEQRDERDQ